MRYLIAHKVRGEVAFDIAEYCTDMGTDTDPGPWWIIPTSGHRAHAIMSWPLDILAYDFQNADGSFTHARVMDDVGPLAANPDFHKYPDHYHSNNRVSIPVLPREQKELF